MNSISNEKIQSNQLFAVKLNFDKHSNNICFVYCNSNKPDANSKFYVLKSIPYSSLIFEETSIQFEKDFKIINSFNQYLSNLGFVASLDSSYYDYQLIVLINAASNALKIYGTRDKEILKEIQNKAVQWWCDFIKTNSFIDNATLKKIKYYLAGQIKANLYAANQGFIIGISYEPDNTFRFIRKKANIEEHIIPHNTTMTFNRCSYMPNKYSINIYSNNSFPVQLV